MNRGSTEEKGNWQKGRLTGLSNRGLNASVAQVWHRFRPEGFLLFALAQLQQETLDCFLLVLKYWKAFLQECKASFPKRLVELVEVPC